MAFGSTSGRSSGHSTPMVHLIHLPDDRSRSSQGDYAGLHLALRAATEIAGNHLILAINSAARLDKLLHPKVSGRIEIGCIAPPNGKLASAYASLNRVLDAWRPQAVILWHPDLEVLGSLIERKALKGRSVIRAWQAPTDFPVSTGTIERLHPIESQCMAIPVSAMARLLAREQLGIAAEDERPLITLLPNVPSSADAWWFSVIVSLMESAGLNVIGAMPTLSAQRGRARRYRHVSGLSTPVIEYDMPLQLILEASDVVISKGRDTDADMEHASSIEQSAEPMTLSRVVICRALACAIPTIVSSPHAGLIPAGLRSMLVADGTRASRVGARVFGLLGTPTSLDQTRRVLAGSLIPMPEAEIISWVRDRLSLRDLHSHAARLAETAG